MNFTYPKNERLCSKILIERLFETSYKQYNSLFKVLWYPLVFDDKVLVKSLISISKHRFKRANKRNLLKRRIREAFRKNKHSLYNTVNKANTQIGIVIIYNSNQISNYQSIESDLLNIFEILKNRISQMQKTTD
jgi:ribonuclease P protein component